MPSALTGEFDAVVEVNVTAVNRILASVHQKGTGEDTHPTFLHSVTARVGNAASDLSSEIAGSLVEYFGAGGVGGADNPQDAGQTLQDKVSTAQEAVRRIGLDLSQLFVVRGTAKIQVGTP